MDRGSSGPDLQSQQVDPQTIGPTQADLDQIARDRDSLRDQVRARDVEILSAQQTLQLLRSDLAAHRAESASDKSRLQTLEGDIVRARQDVEVSRKAYADRERRTLSRDLGKVVRECDALCHEYTAAFQRFTSISATIEAPPPQTNLRLDPGFDTDQPAGGIARSLPKKLRAAGIKTLMRPDPNGLAADPSHLSRRGLKRSDPFPSREDESMEEEDESEFELGEGSTGGESPSPDQASPPPSKDVIEVGSASDDEEEEEEENDDLYEAQTLMAISQSRSEARRRDHASPLRQTAGGSGGSPGGSAGSNSDTGSGDPSNGFGPTGGPGPANPPMGASPVGSPSYLRTLSLRAVAYRVMVAADIDPWIESRLVNQDLIAMSVSFLFPMLPFRPD
ncbi:Hypothetical protein PHPALM_20970 [Phytophthora palmivora]|uniref:Uncharacterized protein n=1 Tax=Phytophthora palmivora TaxID=4796 RepID=A0A2P4XDI3_9STRA|nr:Hypothetical protein PHPALM_20970 [Phytophthora palmivora]